MNPFWINNANPNLNSYKDAASKFKAMNVVYGNNVHRYEGEGSDRKLIDVTELFLDSQCTIPLTLTKMIEMIDSGLPIAAEISSTLCFAIGTYDIGMWYGDNEYVVKMMGLVFSTCDMVQAPNYDPGWHQLAFKPVIGMVDFTEEAANGNLEYGKRPGDGGEDYNYGSNFSPFTIAFGLNNAAQKVIPNPFK